MLAGEKNLAIFCEGLTPGREILEEVIPENAFAPYVNKNEIKRFSRDFRSFKTQYPVRYVCFTLPGQEWRAEAFFWAQHECIAGLRPFDKSYEYFVGRLLKYDEDDIKDFVSKAQHLKICV